MAARDAGTTMAESRKLLQLRHDGEQEHEGSDALMPVRFPIGDKAERQTKGPVAWSLLASCFKAIQEMVLSKATRDLLAGVLKDYASWKPEKRQELCTRIVVRWQCELVDQLGLDHRLFLTTCTRLMQLIPDETKEKLDKDCKECISTQKAYMTATTALTQWYSNPPKPQAVPKADDRRWEAWSLADACTQETRPALQEEGAVDAGAFAKCIGGVAQQLALEETGAALEELAANGEMIAAKIAVDRWSRELFEAHGYQHEFGYLMAVAMQHEEVVVEIHPKLIEATKNLNPRIAAGLRRSKASKDAAAESDKAKGGYETAA